MRENLRYRRCKIGTDLHHEQAIEREATPRTNHFANEVGLDGVGESLEDLKLRPVGDLLQRIEIVGIGDGPGLTDPRTVAKIGVEVVESPGEVAAEVPLSLEAKSIPALG